MKKTLLVLTGVLIAVNSFAQSTYYWSSNKKNILSTDSTSIIVQTTSSANQSATLSLLKAITALKSKSLDSNHIVLKYAVKSDINSVVSQLNRNNKIIKEAIYSYFNGNDQVMLNGKILCSLKPGKSLNDIKALIGADTLQNSLIDQYNVVHLLPKHLKDAINLANKIYESGLVSWCVPDFYSNVQLSSDPNDPYFANQYYLKNTGQTGGTYGIDINVEPAWAITPSATTITVAVIDDGVSAHEDMAGRVVSGYSADITGTGGPISGAVGHGEACAGIIAASNNNNIGISGICSSCIIVPVNIFTQTGNVSVSGGDIATAINWAVSSTGGNADVLSCSWGGGAVNDALTSAITSAMTNGRGGKGTVVVFAAGNFLPNNVAVQYPANVSGVISVGAIDKNGTRWNYSPNSPTLVAPTGNVNWTGDVYTTDIMGTGGQTTGNYMFQFGGTSAACPQVAGTAALILSVNPSLTQATVKSTILNNATSMGNTTNFGVGRLNAGTAVTATSAPPIAGVTAFCSSTTLTVPSAPVGSTISWSASPAGIVSLSTSGNQVTLTKLSQGNAVVTANYSSPYNNLASTVNITTIPTPSIAVSEGSCNNGTMTWTLSATANMAGATNWQWTIQSPGAGGTYYISSPNGSNTYVEVKNGSGDAAVTFQDACGETSTSSAVLVYSPCPGTMDAAVSAYPNPANSQLSVKNSDINAPQTLAANNVNLANTTIGTSVKNTFKVILYNDKGKILRSTESVENNDTVVLNTADIPNGMYFLHVLHGSDKTERKIIIQH